MIKDVGRHKIKEVRVNQKKEEEKKPKGHIASACLQCKACEELTDLF